MKIKRKKFENAEENVGSTGLFIAWINPTPHNSTDIILTAVRWVKRQRLVKIEGTWEIETFTQPLLNFMRTGIERLNSRPIKFKRLSKCLDSQVPLFLLRFTHSQVLCLWFTLPSSPFQIFLPFYFHLLSLTAGASKLNKWK